MKHTKCLSSAKVLLSLGMIFVLGCNAPLNKISSIKHIEEELRIGAYEDCLVQKGCVRKVPDEVRSSLVPNLLCDKAKDPKRTTERRYDIYAEETPARSFFLCLVEDTPFNITVHPEVAGNISLQLKRVTIPEILKITKDVYGFDYRRSGCTIEISPATLQTRSYKINYIDVKRKGSSEILVSAGTLTNSNSGSTTSVGQTTTINNPANQQQIINSEIDSSNTSDFWVELRKTVQCIVQSCDECKDCRVQVSPMSGLLVVTALPAQLRKVEDYLNKAHLTLNRQVILEAKIMEVQLKDSYQAGINWQLLLGRLRAAQFGGEVVKRILNQDDTFPNLNTVLDGTDIPLNPGKVGPGGTILPTFNPTQTDVGHFGGVFALSFNFKNLASFVELLKAQGAVQVLSNPRVTAMNNQKAVIKVGKDEYFVTNVSSSTTTTTSIVPGAIGNQFPNIQFSPFFSGVSLDVTPSIDENNEVTLHIHPIIADVEEDNKTVDLGATFGGPITFPLALTVVRESDNVVKAKSGQVIVIGGLMQDNTAKLKEGIPILMDLPYLGNLFGHVVEKKVKSELVILLRPIVVDDRAWTSIVEEEEDKMGKLDQGCN